MNTRKWTAYILYGVLVTALFLYLLFPAGYVERYVRAHMAGALPGMAVEVGSAVLVLPPGMMLSDLAVAEKEGASPVFEAEKITVRPSMGSLFRNSIVLNARARAYGGNITARIVLPEGNRADGPYEVTANLDALDMGRYSSLNETLGQRIEGTLSGDINYRGVKGTPLEGEGTMNLHLRDGSLSLSADLFGFSAVDFKTVESDMTIKNRTVTIETLAFTGSQINGTLNGKIMLRDPLPRSMLSLRGKINVPALNRQISVYLGGTLEKPSPRLK